MMFLGIVALKVIINNSNNNNNDNKYNNNNDLFYWITNNKMNFTINMTLSVLYKYGCMQ